MSSTMPTLAGASTRCGRSSCGVGSASCVPSCGFALETLVRILWCASEKIPVREPHAYSQVCQLVQTVRPPTDWSSRCAGAIQAATCWSSPLLLRSEVTHSVVVEAIRVDLHSVIHRFPFDIPVFVSIGGMIALQLSRSRACPIHARATKMAVDSDPNCVEPACASKVALFKKFAGPKLNGSRVAAEDAPEDCPLSRESLGNATWGLVR